MLVSIIKKELYVQSRNWKIRAYSLLYIFALAGLAFGLVWYVSTGDASYDPGFGRRIFLYFIFGFIILTYLISSAPAFSIISLERENDTFGQLKLTWLRSYHIFAGKAGLAVIYILILLSASLPVSILMMTLGGITPNQLIKCYLVTFIVTFGFSMIGLMCSSIFKSSWNSGYVAYAINGFFIFGTELIPLILTHVFKIRLKSVIINIFDTISPIRIAFNSLDAGSSPWLVAIFGYILLSAIAICVAIHRLSKFASCRGG